MDYEKLHKSTLAALQQRVSEGKITEEIARSICADFVNESEDERIRKGIIRNLEYLMDRAEGSVKEELQRRIAWLEKQGEQKTDDNLKWNELTWKDINTLEGIINNVHYEFRNGIGAESFGKEVLEKFREIKGNEYMDICVQNPAWSEEDEQMLHEISQCVYNNVVYIGTVNKVKYIDWLKSLKERMKGE